MSNRYSTFPDALDQLKLLSEVQEMSGTQKQKVARYSELALKTSFTSAEEIEFQALYKDLKDFQLNSSDWNKVVETLMNTQRYIKETVLADVGVLVDKGETAIQNKVNEVIIGLDNKVSEIVSNGTAGIDYFNGRTVLALDINYVKVNVPQYNRTTDFLMVYANGGLIVEGTNFIIRPDNFTIESVGGNWGKNTIFDFVVLKRTIITLKYYDAGLFEDGTIRKEKLTAALQSEISKVNTVEKNLADFKIENGLSLDKKMNKQILDDATTKKYEIGIKNGLLYYREVV